MNILFLDIDGVLNSSDWFRGRKQRLLCDPMPDYDLHQIDGDAVLLLNEILTKTGCKVVISSTWRKYSTMEYIIELLVKKGLFSKLKDRFIGMTPVHRIERPQRGNEIQDYLDCNWPRDTKIVIVDDDSDMVHLKNRLVLTNGEHGLTKQDVDKIIKMFIKA
jgi:hypothetical protein